MTTTLTGGCLCGAIRYTIDAPVTALRACHCLMGNEVTLAFLDADGKPEMQHYAFLVSDAEFDQIFGRIQASGMDYWADPGRSQKGAINHHFGGRGVYFLDPSGHLLEIITRPYGSAMPA